MALERLIPPLLPLLEAVAVDDDDDEVGDDDRNRWVALVVVAWPIRECCRWCDNVKALESHDAVEDSARIDNKNRGIILQRGDAGKELTRMLIVR